MLRSRLGLRLDEPLARRSGLIPSGGTLPRTHAGRVMLIGDAAGHVSPLTGGGIVQTLRLGRRCAQLAADWIFAGGDHPGGSAGRGSAAVPAQASVAPCPERGATGLGVECGRGHISLPRACAKDLFPSAARRASRSRPVVPMAPWRRKPMSGNAGLVVRTSCPRTTSSFRGFQKLRGTVRPRCAIPEHRMSSRRWRPAFPRRR
jgi:hypothetical protein